MSVRRVLITGGTSGIGYSTALKFAMEGDKVVITGRNRDAGAKIEQEYKNISYVYADLSNKDDIERLIDETYKILGDLDILVNNAGVLILKGLEEMDIEEFIYTYKVNLFAPFHIMKKVLPRMANNGGGIVINVSSIAGISPYPYGSAYCSSKAALISLSKALALEYASKGIRIVVVAPGLVRTRMALESLGDLDALEKASSKIPLRYVAEPDEISELIYYLTLDRAGYITGSVYVIDGGVTAGRFSSLVEGD